MPCQSRQVSNKSGGAVHKRNPKTSVGQARVIHEKAARYTIRKEDPGKRSMQLDRVREIAAHLGKEFTQKA